jgi:tetratricopeptide (TPR) repeat protein
MGAPPEDPEESPGWSGKLSETPLLTVLRRVQRERLTGALSVFRQDQVRQLFFEKGELLTARSSREDHRIGATLVLWGYISEAELQEALKLQKETGDRIDQILVENGLVTRAVIDSEARRLMEQVIFSTLSWPDGSFHFQPDAGAIDPDVAFSLSATEMIIEGIRRTPESEPFLELLGDLRAIPTLVEDPMTSPVSARLPQEALYLLSQIDGKTDARSLLKLAPGSQTAGAKILYSLLFAGLVEMCPPKKETALRAGGPIEAAGGPPAAAQPPASPRSAETAKNEHRNLIRNTYRRLDWLSHYDLLGISTDSTLEQVEEAYTARSPLFDPDLQSRPDLADCGRELAALSGRLRVAHEVLANPASREAYDRKIAEADSLVLPAAKDATTAGQPEPAGGSAKVRHSTASANYRKALQLIEQHDYSPAIEMLNEAIHFVPDSSEYHYVLGLAMLENRLRRENALEHLLEAARLDPIRPDIQASLAEIYLEQGSLDEARSHAQNATNLASDKGRYRELERRVEEAAQVLEAEKKRGGFLGRLFQNR